jgi:hypothetical protein
MKFQTLHPQVMLQKSRRANAVWHCKPVYPLVLLMASSAGAQSVASLSPAELVRKTVARELAAANAPGHYMYRMTETGPRGSRTREVIETRNWLIGRLIFINGQPLRPEQQQKEDARLRKLLTDRTALRALQKRQHRDEERVRRIMRALPGAFLYEYAGAEREEGGDELARLNFRPNPSFDPSSQELRVLQGMQGTMVIDSTVDRLVRVEAQLVRDVEFGWGILGRLYRGGTFLLEQRDVGSGRWAIAILGMHFTGKILLFKSINVDSVRRATDFRRMPDSLTLEQGLALLLNQTKMTGGPMGSQRRTEAQLADVVSFPAHLVEADRRAGPDPCEPRRFRFH